jgi:transposase
VLDGEIAALMTAIAQQLDGQPGYAAIRELPGIGPVPAAVIVAEIGDVRRFAKPGKLCSWAGLTPRHRESDTKVRRGHVTRQGPRPLRWALTEAVQHQPDGFGPRIVKDSIIARRGARARNVAKVAAARELLTLVYYGLRDGRIRCLSLPAPAQAP